MPSSTTQARTEYVIAACLLGWFACTTWPQAWHTLHSDFANYYVTAHLLREHSSTARIYEWIWFQRQKDHLGIDQNFVSMPALTPFSTLVLWPLASLPALVAKHLWLVCNGFFLLASAWMLQRITALPPSRILLLVAASYPLQSNLLNGQMYLLLLLVLTWGLWQHLHGHRFRAGLAIAIAIGLKVFPVLFVLYFLRKRDWRALAGVAAGAIAVAAVSLAAFGWQLNRIYLLQVLPPALRGETTAPYNLTSASFAILFHRLFVFEPTLNPHPAIAAAWLLPLLLPVAQLLIVAPLLLLVSHRNIDPALEWSAVIIASLTLSPLPASYHFVLLLIPVAVLLRRATSRNTVIAVMLLFLAVGFPYWPGLSGGGWLPLLHVPRLYAMIAVYAVCFTHLYRRVKPFTISKPWIGALATLALVGIATGLRSQSKSEFTYADRLSLPGDVNLLSQPHPTTNGVAYIAMERAGYRAFPQDALPSPEKHDDLSQAPPWIERVTSTSRLVSLSAAPIDDAESPQLSPDGNWLAFLREDRGRATLWLHSLQSQSPDTPATLQSLDVLEASFGRDNSIIFAALRPDRPAALFIRSPSGAITELSVGEARYPAISPDGKWLAYSLLTHGIWNLRLRDMNTGVVTVLTDASCNFVESSWESDSRTLLYADDCGRASGQPAIYRRRVVP